MRCRAELDHSLRRTGTGTVARLDENVLTVRVEHSLAAAEHQLMRRADGRAFFQRYIEELAEQMYPEFRRHVEQILPCTVSYTRVTVDCDSDSIVFSFGLRVSQPKRLYARQLPVKPVTSGIIPIQPHMVFGPTKTSEISPSPTITLKARSTVPSLRVNSLGIAASLPGM